MRVETFLFFGPRAIVPGALNLDFCWDVCYNERVEASYGLAISEFSCFCDFRGWLAG